MRTCSCHRNSPYQFVMFKKQGRENWSSCYHLCGGKEKKLCIWTGLCLNNKHMEVQTNITGFFWGVMGVDSGD